MWLSFALALRILTTVPVAGSGSPGPVVVRRAITLFPFIGALIGLVCGAVWTLGAHLWPGQLLVAAGITLVTEMLLTAARGLGGIGRSADAIAGLIEEGDRTKAITLLRDPRRCSAGVVTIAISVLLKGALLAALRPESAWLTLIVAGCLGQWAVSFAFTLFRLLPAWNNADVEGSFANAGVNEFLGALVLAILGTAILPVRGLIALAVIALIVGPLGRSIDRSFSGVNVYFGYGMGQLAEIIALAVLAVRI